jgi:hypothetical protein
MNDKMNKLLLLAALMTVIVGTMGTVLAGETGEQKVDLIADGDSDESPDVNCISRLILIMSRLNGQLNDWQVEYFRPSPITQLINR